MKRIMFTLSATLLMATGLMAQSFEGTVEYKIDLKGDQAAMVAPYMPSGYKVMLSNDKSRVHMEGGVSSSMGDFLTLDADDIYMIKDADKTAYKMDTKQPADAKDTKAPEVVKTDETETILGHVSNKYKVTVFSPQGPMVIYIWASDEVKIPKPKSKVDVGGMGNSMFYDGITGYPLKMEMPINQGGMNLTMTMTCTKIDEGKVNADLLKLPEGYSVKPYDPKAMMGGMGH